MTDIKILFEAIFIMAKIGKRMVNSEIGQNISLDFEGKEEQVWKRTK